MKRAGLLVLLLFAACETLSAGRRLPQRPPLPYLVGGKAPAALEAVLPVGYGGARVEADYGSYEEHRIASDAAEQGGGFPAGNYSIRGVGAPVMRPGHAIGRPGHAVGRPSHAVRRPGRATGRPGHAVRRPSHAIRRSEHAIGRPGHAIRRPAAAIRRPQHPVARPSHPVRRPAVAVTRPASPIRR